MANRLGPIDIQCDAPPYSIVQACHTVGFITPEDVRWWRLSHFLSERFGWRDSAKRQFWKIIGGTPDEAVETCSCGEKLPLMEGYTFTFTTGEEVSYRIGQCRRCRSVFWDDI